MYYMLLARPEFSGVFPGCGWYSAFPSIPRSCTRCRREYFVEPTVGVLWVAPFLLAIFLLRTRHAK